MKKIYLAVLAIAIVSFMSMGCFTTLLWNNDRPNVETTTYDDSIQAFLMSQDGKKIIFISHDYHYIIESDSTLSFLLTHKNDINITYELQKGSYYVINNNISATFSANLDINDSNPNLIKEVLLHKNGILNKKTGIIRYNFHLNGIRYQSNTQINNTLIKFDHPIILNINQGYTKSATGETIKKIAMTPITIAADGACTAIFVGMVVILSPIIIPVAIVGSQGKHK
jgi:hypothetical protein